MSTRITKKLALEGLEKAVAKRGADYIYPQPDGLCKYVYQGAPSCIVGEVMAPYVEPERLEAFEQKPANRHGIRVPSTLRGIEETLDVTFTRGALHVLNAAQVWQDAQNSWGESLETAKGGAE